MARIPKIEAGSLLSGAPRRALRRSGVSASGLASAFADVAASADAISESRQNLEIRLAEMDDLRHANQAETSLRKLVVDWEADTNNLADESGHEKIHQLLRQEKHAQSSGFKTVRARESFEARSDNLILSTYANAAARSTSLKVQRTAGSMVELNQSSLLSRNPDHEKTLDRLLEQADALFAASPDSGIRFKEQLVRDSVLGLLATDPDRAERLLSSHKLVDGPTRNQLMGQIEAARESRGWAKRQDHLGYVQDKLTVAKGAGANPDPGDPNFSLETFRAVHGEQRGTELHASFMRDAKPVFEANSLWAEMFKGRTPDEMVQRLDQYTSNLTPETAQGAPDAPTRLRVAEELRRRVSRSLQDLQEKGPVAWINENDPHVSALRNVAMRPESVGPVEDADKQAYADALLASQRRIGVGMPSLLTRAETDALVSTLEADGSPDTAMNVVASLQARFPDPEHLNIALSDLYRSKAPRSLALVALNRNQPWLPAYSDAVQNRGAYAKAVDADDLKKLDASVEKAFAPWAQALTAGRVGDVPGYLDGLKSMALRSMAKSGTSPNKAAEAAVELLLGSELQVLDFGGRPTILSKAVPDTAQATVGEYRKRLDLAALDLTPFEPLKAQFASDEDFHSLLEDLLADSMFPVMSPDGSSLLFSFTGDGDVDFLLKDKEGRPLSLDIEDIKSWDWSDQMRRFHPPEFTGKGTNWPLR